MHCPIFPLHNQAIGVQCWFLRDALPAMPASQTQAQGKRNSESMCDSLSGGSECTSEVPEPLEEEAPGAGPVHVA